MPTPSFRQPMGGNTLPRHASKRLSTAPKSSIPRFKRPHSRPVSAVLSTSLLPTPSSSRALDAEAGTQDDLATPRASTFDLTVFGDKKHKNGSSGGSSNGTNTAEASMTSSMVMDTETREASPSGEMESESRDILTEMASRCRIGSSGYPTLVKAKRLKFYRNGDQYFKGITYALQSDRVKSMQPLMEDLMKTAICDSTALPHGIRHIFSIDGQHRVTSVEQFEDGCSYVCASTDAFKGLDYARAAEPSWRLTLASQTNKHLETKKLALSVVELPNERTDFVFPRIIKVIRNGVKPRKIVRHLLNKKTARSFDQVLTELTSVVKLDSGRIRKMFALSGREVRSLEDFFGADDVFIAYGGNERMAADDFLFGPEESRHVGTSQSGNTRTGRRRVMPCRNESLRSERSFSVIPDEAARRLPAELDDKFAMIRLIGDGNTAVVYEVCDKETEERRAMKVVARENVVGNEHLIEAELSILRRIQNEYIVQLYDSWSINDTYYLSLELVEMGDLFEHLREVKRVAETDAVRMIACLGKALEYIHDLGVVHRDVKLENLLICRDEYGELGVKLADFGLATDVPSGGGSLTTICGTPTYVAPEVLNGTGYGAKVDIWAAGVILYAILVGFPPFQSADGSEQDLFSQIQSGQFTFPSPAWDEISWSVRHLIMQLVQLDAFHRYSASEMLRDEWVATSCNVDEEYEEWAEVFVKRKMVVDTEMEGTSYEYFSSRRTSMDELSETGRDTDFSFRRAYS